MQEVEIFNTKREFNNKFPHKMYICSKCGNAIGSPTLCIICRNQANNFIEQKYEKYQYIIKEISDEIYQIFLPVEKQFEE